MAKSLDGKTKKQIFSEKLQEKWRPIIHQWREIGQTQRGFCQAHKLSFVQFTYWRRKFLGTSPIQGPKLVKVFDRDPDKSISTPPQEPQQEISGVRVFFRDFCLEVKPYFSEEALLMVAQTLRRT